MSIKKLNLLDEGSWALMIEESNVRALHRYNGSMAGLDIDYYLSIGTNRYYKGYFEDTELARVREGIVRFLLDDATYFRCVSDIGKVLDRMRHSGQELATLSRPGQFDLYCDLLCEYIAFYNSVITDTFYDNVFNIVGSEIPENARFAAKAIKDSLFATDNNDLLTHAQTVDLLALSRRHVDGEGVDDDIDAFIERYRSISMSSGSPNGMTATEVKQHLMGQTMSSVRSEEAFLANLHFRYDNAESWGKRTATVVGLSETTRLLVERTCAMSHLKIKMREEFQDFKITVRQHFLTELITAIGKQHFDYMRIDEIATFIRSGEVVPPERIAVRRALTVFELAGGRIEFLDAIPQTIELVQWPSQLRATLHGDVLIGTGTHRYRVRKVEQHEEGLSSLDDFIRAAGSTQDIVVITNVLRPHLVPKLRKFGALITQYGGYTSHASVLCRELGINSMISVNGLLDALDTDDYIEVDFDEGMISEIIERGPSTPPIPELVLDICATGKHTNRAVGAKAANLMRINRSAQIASGFVVTNRALKTLDDPETQRIILHNIASMNCGRLVIRSSHESEDSSSGSYAGLFESYVDVDANDTSRIIDLIRAVRASVHSESVKEYGAAEGHMSVIVQEMIDADVSGVILTSSVFDGFDYLLVEYVVGGLSYLMQGDVTPLSAYIRKLDIINGSDAFHAYPAVISDDMEQQFKVLARTAIELEREFSHRVQIEWGMRNGKIYIFQVRPY